jgi:signal transduction histidine kinase
MGSWWRGWIERRGSRSRHDLLPAQNWTTPRRNLLATVSTLLLINILFVLAGAAGIWALARRFVFQRFVEQRKGAESLCDIETLQEGGNAQLTSAELTQLTPNRSEREKQVERRRVISDRLAATANLAAGFAHEIGTPLGVIRGLAEMLLSSSFDRSEMVENLEIIVAQADRITRMVKLLLDIGRCRSAIRVTSDVRAIVQRGIQLIKREAERRGIEVIANLGPRPLMVDCDPDQLQQVFVNLGSNSLDAMTPGGGKLLVRSLGGEAGGGVRLSFEDTGPGVPVSIRARIFDPFFTTKGAGQSDGIGLTVSQFIIADHNGELTLEQHLRGACFVVTLPISKSLETQPQQWEE